jgi:hypothetical protein
MRDPAPTAKASQTRMTEPRSFIPYPKIGLSRRRTVPVLRAVVTLRVRGDGEEDGQGDDRFHFAPKSKDSICRGCCSARNRTGTGEGKSHVPSHSLQPSRTGDSERVRVARRGGAGSGPRTGRTRRCRAEVRSVRDHLSDPANSARRPWRSRKSQRPTAATATAAAATATTADHRTRALHAANQRDGSDGDGRLLSGAISEATQVT